MIMVLLALGNVFRGDIGMFYQLVGKSSVVEELRYFGHIIYRMLTTSPNVGLTAAAGLYQSVLCFVTILVANGIVKKSRSPITRYSREEKMIKGKDQIIFNILAYVLVGLFQLACFLPFDLIVTGFVN